MKDQTRALPKETERLGADERRLTTGNRLRQAAADEPGDQIGDLPIGPFPEKSIGATGFEPAT